MRFFIIYFIIDNNIMGTYYYEYRTFAYNSYAYFDFITHNRGLVSKIITFFE